MTHRLMQGTREKRNGTGIQGERGTAAVNLNFKPTHHESCQFVTINGVQKQSLPIFEVRLDSLDHRTSERVEITGSKMADFTTVRRPTVK